MKQKCKESVIFIKAVLLINLICVICLLSGAVWAKGIIFKGSAAVLPIAQMVAEAYMKENPSVRISVEGGGTIRGVKSLIQGTVQIGMASVEISKELEQFAREKGVELMFHKIGYDAVMPVVQPDNPIFNVSMDQLKQIYAGTITDWKEIGGVEAPIEVLTLSRNSGAYQVWRNYVMKGEPMMSEVVQYSEEELFRVIKKNLNAIGYLPVENIKKGVRPLSINGVYGYGASILAGKFPIRRVLGLFVRKGNSDPDIKQLVKNFREITIGQYFMKLHGMTPLE